MIEGCMALRKYDESMMRDEDEDEYMSWHKLHFTFEFYTSAVAICVTSKYRYKINSKVVKKENLTNNNNWIYLPIAYVSLLHNNYPDMNWTQDLQQGRPTGKIVVLFSKSRK